MPTLTADIAPLWRFRAAAMRRAVALTWVVLAILAAQAVRQWEENFDEVGFAVAVVVMALVLLASSLIDWYRVMPTHRGPWATLAWTASISLCLVVVGTQPGMETLTPPMFFGVVALSGLVLDRFKHVLITILSVASLAFLAFTSDQPLNLASLLVQIFSVIVVATATALMGYEFEQESTRSARRLTDLQRQRADFERLYAVSATLAGAESLSEVLPELVGRICTYLNAQVGVVMLYVPDSHELRLMDPIWVTGYPLEAGDVSVSVSAGGVLAQVFKSGKPVLLDQIAERSESYGILGELGLKEAMVAPLRVEQFKVGVIAVGDPVDGSFGRDQLEALSSLGAPAALVLSQLGRYEAVAEMTRRLEEVAQMKTDFVSVVSHELRTPLTSIIGSLDTVARPELAPQAETARNLLNTARRQAGRLQRLIEDLLIVSRLERNAVPIQLEKVVLEKFLSELAATLQIPDLSIEVMPADLTVLSDPDHLNRIFLNLLENAIKYAPSSPVEVRAAAKGNRVEVAVSDHGAGIPADMRERIFHRFTQLEGSATRTRGGTGLGLNIVKGLAEAMHGSVELIDTPGGGATFVVSLPLTEPAPALAYPRYSVG
ncbi:MAG TPA: ATP-binding protein [Acidimicrobiia bacterium]|nr:ATP-binding protein [Acidimicrobiia bacterium]